MNSDSLEAVTVRYQQKRTPSSISVSSHVKRLLVLRKAPGLYKSYLLLLILLLLLLRRGAMWMQIQMVNWIGYKSNCLCLMAQHKHVSCPNINTHAQKTFCCKQFVDKLTWMLANISLHNKCAYVIYQLPCSLMLWKANPHGWIKTEMWGGVGYCGRRECELVPEGAVKTQRNKG